MEKFLKKNWPLVLLYGFIIYYYFANYPDTALFGNTTVAHNVFDPGVPPAGNPADMTGLTSDIYTTKPF